MLLSQFLKPLGFYQQREITVTRGLLTRAERKQAKKPITILNIELRIMTTGLQTQIQWILFGYLNFTSTSKRKNKNEHTQLDLQVSLDLKSYKIVFNGFTFIEFSIS